MAAGERHRIIPGSVSCTRRVAAEVYEMLKEGTTETLLNAAVVFVVRLLCTRRYRTLS
jgi:hypothetical protein